jgi:Family of unknown function (DUF5677)
MEQTLKKWSQLSKKFNLECFHLAESLLNDDQIETDPLIAFVLAQLNIDCHLSSESVLLLISEQKEWEADLIARSVMEGTFKFTYMLDGNKEDIKTKVNEYWHLLPQFAVIKHSERAESFLSEVPNRDSPEWLPLQNLILDDSIISSIRNKYPRKERMALEEKWSFSGICKAFSKSENSGLTLFSKSIYSYGMSSHMVHKDADGIGMACERSQRSSDRLAAVQLGHSARLVSDICTYTQLRTFSLLRAYNQPLEAFKGIEENYSLTLFSELERANQAFTEIEYGINQPTS